MDKKHTFGPEYYRWLGLHDGADEQEIRAAYRLLARRYHPDVNPDKTVRTRFLEIQQAYDTLGSEQSRAAYNEWLNALPTRERPVVQVRQTLGPTLLRPLDEPQAAFLLLDLRVDEALRNAHLPLNLCLVIDRSSSMRGSRLSQVRRATRAIIDQLEAMDVFSLVTFSDRATVILPAHRQLRKEVAKSLVDNVEASGGTEIYQGLYEGINQILRYHEPDSLSHLILLTDGNTYGDADNCLRLAEDANHRHITITALGIGTDWNDKFLDALARSSHGMASYIVGPTEVLDTFQSHLSRLRSIVGRETVLQLTPSTGVHIRGAYLLSPEIDELPRADQRISFGGLSFDRPTVILIEIVVEPLPVGVQSLLTWNLEVDLAPLGRPAELLSREVLLDVREQESPFPEMPDIIVDAQSRLTAFKLRRQAWHDLEAGHPTQASQRLQGVATRLFDLHEDELAVAVLNEADYVRHTGTMTDDRGKWIKYGTRRLALPGPGNVP